MVKFDPSIDLNTKQQTFCQEYAVHGEPKKAGLKAGYTKTGAARHANTLLRDPRIKAFVQQLRDEASERAGLTLDATLKRVQAVYDGAMEASDFAQANKACELQLKTQGALQNTSQIHVHGSPNRKNLEEQILRFAPLAGETVET